MTLQQRLHVRYATDVTEAFRQTTAEPHATEQSPVNDDDGVLTTVRLERLPFAHVQPTCTSHSHNDVGFVPVPPKTEHAKATLRVEF